MLETDDPVLPLVQLRSALFRLTCWFHVVVLFTTLCRTGSSALQRSELVAELAIAYSPSSYCSILYRSVVLLFYCSIVLLLYLSYGVTSSDLSLANETPHVVTQSLSFSYCCLLVVLCSSYYAESRSLYYRSLRSELHQRSFHRICSAVVASACWRCCDCNADSGLEYKTGAEYRAYWS